MLHFFIIGSDKDYCHWVKTSKTSSNVIGYGFITYQYLKMLIAEFAKIFIINSQLLLVLKIVCSFPIVIFPLLLLDPIIFTSHGVRTGIFRTAYLLECLPVFCSWAFFHSRQKGPCTVVSHTPIPKTNKMLTFIHMHFQGYDTINSLLPYSLGRR